MLMLHMTFDTLSQCHIYRNNAKISIVQLLCWCFTALRHISGHFGRGQLSISPCSWARLLGSLQVLSAYSFANNWQLPFLNQGKGENGRRNYFMTKLHERMLPDVKNRPRDSPHTRWTRIRSSYCARQYCAVFNKLFIWNCDALGVLLI